MESSLIKYSAKDYFFRAALCHLCVDSVNAQHAIERYEEQFPAFGDSRECKLVKNLIKHLEDEDVDAFTGEVTDYKKTALKLGYPWYIMMVERAKKQIPNEDDIC